MTVSASSRLKPLPQVQRQAPGPVVSQRGSGFSREEAGTGILF